MKAILNIFILSFLVFFLSCDSDESLDASDSSAEFSSASGNGGATEAGLITAGEWNDVSHWNFWNTLLEEEKYSNMSNYWNFHTNNRVSVQVINNGVPMVSAQVELIKDGAVVWTARTDNFGKAELWVGMFQKENVIDSKAYSIKVNTQFADTGTILFGGVTNIINDNSNSQDAEKRVEISFIVDATGSMGDELKFLKKDLRNVIQKVQNNNSTMHIATAAVFYRDIDDEYLIRKSDFTNNSNETLEFINKQSAGGGGDFPEAVHTALHTAINDLQWSTTARTKIAFLILDAPPHYTEAVLNNIHNTVVSAAQKGIKIIPITASGIDKETEFLMRFLSIATNGTYVFITNDSGIGNNHIEASVGEYEVEHLNDLLVRLLNKYIE